VNAGASVANSIAIRCMHDPRYRPSNLNLPNGVPVGYQLIPVVAEPAAI
jgi:hypothetical protein